MKIGLKTFNFPDDIKNDLELIIKKADEYKINVVDMSPESLNTVCCKGTALINDKSYFERVLEAHRKYGVDIEMSIKDEFIKNGSNQPVDGLMRLIKEVYVPLDVKLLTVTSTHHRWRNDPPLEEQLKNMAKSLKILADVAGEYDIKIAIENHADYRCEEVARIIDMADCEYLGAKFDTANCVCVLEDSIDAARKIAPYCFAVHAKDIAAFPYYNGMMLNLQARALGEGIVDLETALGIIVRNAPNSNEISYVVEIDSPTKPLYNYDDKEEAAKVSLEYLRKILQKEGL